MHVLVMSESWQAALACIQSFGRRRHVISVLHGGRPSPHAFSSFVKNRMAFNHEDGSRVERARRLVEMMVSNGVDLVIPISDEDAHVLSLSREMAPHLRGLIAPSQAAVETVRDRESTQDFCERNGIRIPASRVVRSGGEAVAAAKELGYPLVIKKPYSVGSAGVRILRNPQELQALDWLDGTPVQLQQFIQGEFVGITGFAWKGRLLAAFPFRVDYEHSQAGTPPYARSMPDEGLSDVLDRFTRALMWDGGIDADLLRDHAGQLYLLEANPRMSGTTIFPYKCGIDLPRFYEHALMDTLEQAQVAALPAKETLFVTYPEEIRWISMDPHGRLQAASKARAAGPWLDSLFTDDPGLTRLQIEQFVRTAWLAPRAIHR